MSYLEELGNAVIKGNVAEVQDLTNRALDEDAEPMEIIKEGLIKGMNVVGQRFKKGDMFVPEVLMAAKAMKGGMNIVKPLVVEGDMPSAGKVMLGTVSGDLHDIGKNLVGMLMESGGLELVNLGVDITAEEFATEVREHKPDVLGMSALLTTTMLEMKNTIEILEEEGLRDDLKIIIGGAPVTQDFADEIGADGWAPDAASAKDLAVELMEEK